MLRKFGLKAKLKNFSEKKLFQQILLRQLSQYLWILSNCTLKMANFSWIINATKNKKITSKNF